SWALLNLAFRFKAYQKGRTLEISLRHRNLLYDEDDAHGFGAAVVRGRDEGCVLAKCVLKFVQHTTVARRLNNVCERCTAIAEDIRDNDHVVIAFMIVRV